PEEHVDRAAFRVGEREAVVVRAAHDEVSDPVAIHVADGERRAGVVTRPVALRRRGGHTEVGPDRAAENPIRLTRPGRAGRTHHPPRRSLFGSPPTVLAPGGAPSS